MIASISWKFCFTCNGFICSIMPKQIIMSKRNNVKVNNFRACSRLVNQNSRLYVHSITHGNILCRPVYKNMYSMSLNKITDFLKKKLNSWSTSCDRNPESLLQWTTFIFSLHFLYKDEKNCLIKKKEIFSSVTHNFLIYTNLRLEKIPLIFYCFNEWLS